jgi:4-hydroxybenzoate polyprenyltransferase
MSSPRALLVSLRPHQWTKNLVVLGALTFSKHLFEPDAVARALLAFVTFCALSGATYLLNDLVDLEGDRLHPLKRLRPLASGALPVGLARGVCAALAVAGLAAALALRFAMAPIIRVAASGSSCLRIAGLMPVCAEARLATSRLTSLLPSRCPRMPLPSSTAVC